MGKYDKVVKDLPKLPVEQTDYQQRVEEAKQEFRDPDTGSTLSTSALVEAYVRLRRQKDVLEEQEKALNLRLEALGQLVIAAFEAEDIESMKLADGAAVRVGVKPYPGVSDKEAFRVWCLGQGLEHEMHLHPSTMAALINERLLSGETVPCHFCKGQGAWEAADDGLCPQCKGNGTEVAPGVKVFAKSTPYLTGR